MAKFQRSDVTIGEVKKGDVVLLKRRPAQANGLPFPKTGTVLSVNRQRGMVRLAYRAVVGGVLVDCRTYIKPADINGFYVQGTPF